MRQSLPARGQSLEQLGNGPCAASALSIAIAERIPTSRRTIAEGRESGNPVPDRSRLRLPRVSGNGAPVLEPEPQRRIEALGCDPLVERKVLLAQHRFPFVAARSLEEFLRVAPFTQMRTRRHLVSL